MDDEEFLRIRRAEVLPQWRTGEEVTEIDRGLEYQLALSPSRRASNLFVAAHEEGRVLTQPRHGDTLFDDQLRVMKDEQAAGADIISIEVDAYTRQRRFELAEDALVRSTDAQRSLVCGYPILAHGVAPTRRIVEALDQPISQRMASEDSRLCKEIFIASGVTYFVVGALQQLAYEKDATLASMIRNYQYEQKLFSYFTERGAPIVWEATATLTGTLVPPAMAITTSIIDALLAAEQGVKHIVSSYGTLGHLTQDVAAVRAMREVTRQRLDADGHSDVTGYVVCSQWMSDFPHNESAALAVICYGTTVAALAPSDEVMVKSTQEAFGVPDAKAQVDALVATNATLKTLRGQYLTSSAVDEEQARIVADASLILDTTLDLGNGDWALGAVRALEAGVIDVPFSPSRFNAGLAIPARDLTGALRYLDPGNVPLSDESRAFQAELMDQRLRSFEGTRSDLVAYDVFSMSKRLDAQLATAG